MLGRQDSESIAKVRATLLPLAVEPGAHLFRLTYPRRTIDRIAAQRGTARGQRVHAPANRAATVGGPTGDRGQPNDLGVGQAQVARAREEVFGTRAGRSAVWSRSGTSLAVGGDREK